MITIKEYINKNLPNLNWNILPQIFEENEVELTEEIKTYLKNTPWNTNWNIINSISEKDNITKIINLGIGTNNFLEGSEITSTAEILAICNANINDGKVSTDILQIIAEGNACGDGRQINDTSYEWNDVDSGNYSVLLDGDDITVREED